MIKATAVNEVYYFNNVASHSVDFYVNSMLSCSSIEDGINIYLDMKTNVSLKSINQYMKQKIYYNGQYIIVKELPIIKKIYEELEYLRILDYEVLVGASVNSDGEMCWYGAQKYEILKTEVKGLSQVVAKDRENAIIKAYLAKRNFYASINKAIKEANIPYLKSNFTFLEETPCYRWVILFYNLQTPELQEDNTIENSLILTNSKTKENKRID